MPGIIIVVTDGHTPPGPPQEASKNDDESLGLLVAQ